MFSKFFSLFFVFSFSLNEWMKFFGVTINFHCHHRCLPAVDPFSIQDFLFFFFILIWVFFSVFFSSKTFHLNFSMLFFLFCYLTIRWCCFDFALVTLFNWRFSIYRIQTLKIRMDLQVKLKNKKNLCNHIYIMWYTIVCLQMITWWLTQPKKKKFKMQRNETKTKKNDPGTLQTWFEIEILFSSFSYIFFFVCLNWTCSPVCVCVLYWI